MHSTSTVEKLVSIENEIETAIACLSAFTDIARISLDVIGPMKVERFSDVVEFPIVWNAWNPYGIKLIFFTCSADGSICSPEFNPGWTLIPS